MKIIIGIGKALLVLALAALLNYLWKSLLLLL